MVRAGEGGRLIEEFEKGFVAIGWSNLGDLSRLSTKENVAALIEKKYPEIKPSKKSKSIGVINKFLNVVGIGDIVVSYDTSTREYLVGEIVGNYEYSPDTVGDYHQIRRAKWYGRVSRDELRTSSKNSLGSLLTLFALKPSVVDDLLRVLEGRPAETAQATEVAEEEEGISKEDVVNQSKELIKDLITALDAEEMEELVAALLRAMGFRARVSPKGPDRGVDVIASPDGLGLQEPRIKAEVKHRSGSMGSQAIRSFIGALRPGDRGIYVSTGGFSKESRYEAERANIPVSLVDIDELASLVVDFYEEFDLDGKALIPLVRIYWPAEL
ncbi:restriction endonuclease [Pseudohalioglobus sediminis]|uniref:Restriction endonuclease n=2 Tax=Pseudohalioglobus sediminis TaxID=2606449 RepID=A0A5B0X5R2_9GAMM|nr:restriction endonuclease [Pseudohalioglobus sediminis]